MRGDPKSVLSNVLYHQIIKFKDRKEQLKRFVLHLSHAFV